MAHYTIEAVTQARLQSPEGLRQRMRTRHGRILGDVELPTDLRWDPIIHALCSLLQQATDRDKKSTVLYWFVPPRDAILSQVHFSLSSNAVRQTIV